MTYSRQRTIFIIIGRGFIAKTILRSGVLEHLKKSGARIVLFFYDAHGVGIPQYLREEFVDTDVVVEGVMYPKVRGFHRRFWMATNSLVYNIGTRDVRYARA